MALRVGIVGGGIGGLTAAIALRAHGLEPTVFERSTSRGSEGIGLLVWANAVRALKALGIDLAAVAAPIVHTQIRSDSGDVLCSLPIDDWSTSTGARSVAIRRPVLVRALTAAVPEGIVETDRTVSRFETRGDGVVVTLSDGTRRDFDVLVGADGLSSVVRMQLLGDSPIRVMDQRLWVGLARPRAGLLKEGLTLATIGRGPRFWIAPLPEGEAFWFATFNRSDSPRGSERPRDFLMRELADWPAPIDEVLRATRDEDIIEARSCDRVPTERWGEGPVTLLGDAAHASTPDLGMGACQAIESASVLARCLAECSEPAAGLRAYEKARIEHTATVSRMSWITSQNTTMESAMLCAVRDAGIRMGLPTIARRNFAWLMGHAG